jgi:hypothetical protein
MKNGNFVGISITDGGSGQYAQAYLQGFTLTSAGGDSSDGLQINTIGRIRCARLFISNHGGHGLEIVQGSVGRYDDITSTGNAGDGFRLTGSGPVQANANVFTNIDTRGNGGWGFNLLTAMTNMGTGVTCQSNTAGGIQLGACFCNRLDVYCESNSGPDISFTTACAVPYGGNLIYAVYLDKAPVYNGSSGTGNAVYTNRSGPVYQPAISQLIADLVTFSNTRTDGTTPDGTFSIVHNNNLELDVIAGAYSAHQKTVFSNSQSASGYMHGVQADNLIAAGAALSWGTGVLSMGSTTSVGATSGSATALPPNPAGYLQFYLGDTPIKIPYYNN